MRAQRLKGLKEFELVEIEQPVSVDGQVIVKIETCGICGTDLHYWKESEYAAGWIMGHECGGYVVDPGDREDLAEGDRVVVIPGNPCGECYYCLANKPAKCLNVTEFVGGGIDGAYAEYLAMRSDMILPLPDEISFDEAAMVEPGAVANHVSKMAKVKEGEQILIAGCGIIGLLTAVMCRNRGASEIVMTDVNQYRLDTALKMGIADKVLNATDSDYVEKANAMTEMNLGFWKYIDCVGNARALKTNIGVVRAEGEIIMAGFPTVDIPVDIMNFDKKELSMQGIFGYEVQDIIEVIGMLATKQVDMAQFITDHIKLDGLQEAYERLTSSDNKDIKIIVNPQL